MSSFEFLIRPNGAASAHFMQQRATTFSEAADFVRHLPYQRNSSRHDPLIIFKEMRGTCSTKHAALALLAEEHQQSEVQLCIGIYRMNRQNTPGIGDTMEQYELNFLPEAHTYLRINGTIFDCTGISSGKTSFADSLMEEIVIRPEQVGDFKVDYHRSFIQNWLAQQSSVSLSFDELWRIREQCIQRLSQ